MFLRKVELLLLFTLISVLFSQTETTSAKYWRSFQSLNHTYEMENVAVSDGIKKEEFSSAPKQLLFPKLKMGTEIIPTGIDENGYAEVVPGVDVLSWYKYSNFETGNLIISGHRDWKGELGLLRNLEKPDLVEKVDVVFEENKIRRYRLVSVEKYKASEFPSELLNVYSEKEKLTLISCAGPFMNGGYQQRIVGIFEPIE